MSKKAKKTPKTPASVQTVESGGTLNQVEQAVEPVADSALVPEQPIECSELQFHPETTENTDNIGTIETQLPKSAPLTEQEISAIYEKHGVDRDYGPSHPRWGVPSDMNAFKLVKEELY